MKIYTTILTIFLIFFTYSATAKWPDIDIDLSSCEPDGLFSSVSHSWNPLKFWARQYTRLEMALKEENLRDLLDECRMQNTGNKTELIECYQYYKNRHQSMVKCLRHSKKLCRHHGGLC